jgi:Kef-type K+ transport system membrane component KefB
MIPKDEAISGPIQLRAWLNYAAMLAIAIGLFFVIKHWGMGLESPEVAGSTGKSGVTAPATSEALVHVLVALTAVLVVGRLLAVFFRFVGQPPVIGEIVAGILLGPSLLGRVWPEAAAFVLPASVAPNLGMIAQLGVVLYMFLVGLELNPELLRERAHSTVAISHASILAPFLLGSSLALFLYPRLAPEGVPFTSFSLFMGVAMSITAFPVLARILTDRGMQKTPLGVIALGCAATDDVTAWCLLAFVIGVAQAKVGGAFLVLGWTLAYIAFMFLVVRPAARNFFMRFDERQISTNLVALVFALLLASALVTEYIGIHAVFGAFLAGAIIPHDSAIARALTQRLESLVTVLLLPAFFAFTGMRTQIGLVSGYEQWLICGLIILVATAGKFGGALAAARLTGMNWRDSTALGLLMNTRGLMELIVLNIGLDMGVISPALFAMMVVMALVTTMTASPFLPRVALEESIDDRAAAIYSPP